MRSTGAARVLDNERRGGKSAGYVFGMSLGTVSCPTSLAVGEISVGTVIDVNDGENLEIYGNKNIGVMQAYLHY